MKRPEIVLGLIVILFAAAVNIMPAEAEEEDYHLQPEDVLEITVYEQEDLITKTRISSKGEIAFPLLGKIKISGLTVSEAESMITGLLARDYLVNPQVRVFIEEYHVKQISVLGAVQQPGKYDMSAERATTVLEAIAMAGGFNDVADENSNRIIRKDGNEEKIIRIKVSEITKRGKKEKDIVLNPGDIIFVSESFL